MTKKLNSMPDYVNKSPRHPHDLGQSFAFTSSTGMELPIYCDILHTGDHVYFNANMFTRMNPLKTAALGEIDVHLDYFFVPLSVMYTPSTSLFYQTDDLLSSLVDKSALKMDRFPLLDVDTTLDNISNQLNNACSFKDMTGYFSVGEFDCIGKSAVRLLDLLGYSVGRLFDSENAYNPTSTPWFLLAYHACHQLYFRNDDRERKSYLYNIDNQYNNASSYSQPSLFYLNYVSSYKDYFNSVKVSPIGSSVSMLSNSTSIFAAVNNYLSDQTQSPVHSVRPNYSNSTGFSDSTQVNITTYAQTNFVTSQNIRAMFAFEKLLRVIGRAEKDYESQFLAHFGVKIPHDALHNITHIGHDKFTISPSPVISSANTWNGSTGDGSALGEIGGQGQASFNGKQRHFEAPFHGVFICIYHAVPRFRYYGGIDKLNTLYRPMDFWQPEYDHMGMQPLWYFEVDRDSPLNNTRLGWQFGYEHFKRKYDRISLAFKHGDPNYVYTSVNNYAPWVISRMPFRDTDGFNIANVAQDNPDITSEFTAFLSTPKDLDSIMYMSYSTRWIDGLTQQNLPVLFYTDPFINDFRMNFKKVNEMSEYSEPEL